MSARRLVAVLALFAAGCRGCSNEKAVAEVRKHQGDLTHDTAAQQQHWEPAADGTKLGMGDGLRTGAKSEALVKLTRGGTLKLPPETTIRFLSGAPGSESGKLAVEAGEASIEAEGGEVTIETSIGLAHIESGGTLRVAAAPGGSTRFEVSIGSARIDTEDGGVALTPGKAFEISLGGAIVEREIADASADASKRVEAAPATVAVDAGPSPVAVEVHGKGGRVQAKGSKTWQALAEGSATVSYGDVLDVPSGVSIDVRRGADQGRVVGAGKFVVGDADGPLVTANGGGKVELDATTTDVLVAVPGGVIVAKRGGHVNVDVGAKSAKLTVTRGEAEVRGKTTETVRAGEGAAVDEKGAVTLPTRGPDRADFFAQAGESLVVRDPHPPTAIGFDFSSVCSGAGVVARADVTARGDHRAALYFPAGVHNYTVRCIGPDGVDTKPASTGTVSVVADSARAELPRLPPATLVDMDGRRYTVMYQNLLPSVIARWQEAPAGATGIALHLDGQTIKADGPKHSFKAGTIGEGAHTLWFATADGSKKSAETTLVLKFDNAAPAASVREPEDGSFKPGDSVKVSGSVVEGWTVSVDGQPVSLDDQRRFATTVTAPVSENAVVIRLSHPQRGTVHYVRHAGVAR